jgi:signal transduction histidine kinase
LILTNLSGDDAVVQLVGPEGVLLAATQNAADLAPIGPLLPDVEESRTVNDLPVEDDEYRVLSRTIETSSGTATLHVAANIDDLRGTITVLELSLLTALVLSSIGLSALVWFLVGRTLRPVERIRAEVASIGDADLGRRVPESGIGDDIDRLAHTMNDMLERIEDSVRRQNRFVADASHELRSPLTRIRTDLEVDRSDALANPEETYERVLEEVIELSALLDDLLILARADARQGYLVQRPVDLDDIVLDEVGGIRPRSKVEIDLSNLSAAHLLGDPGQLRRMVRNLLDNAVRHAHSRVEVTLEERPGTATIEFTVVDDGAGVPDDLAEAVFARFARVDDARGHGLGGSGLGLAITRDIVQRHGGEVWVDTAYRDGARFCVLLPSCP